MESAMDMLAETEASMRAPPPGPPGSEANPEGTTEEAKTEEAAETTEPETKFRLFVGQIPQGTTMAEFSEYCKTIGAEADFLKEGSERPFGFINVFSEEKKNELLNGEQLEFKETKLRMSLAKTKTVKFFLHGVSKEMEEQISEHFKKYGKVVEAFVVKDRGFGFVTLESQQIKVLDAVPNDTHEIGGKNIDVKVAQPKGPRGGGRGGRGGYGGRGG